MFDLDRHFDLGDLAELRPSLAARAGEHTTDRRQIDGLLLIATELATNAIRHGGGRGRLQLWHRGTTLYCRVTDAGPGLTRTDIGRVRPEPTATGGRGLWLCRRLARLLYVHAGPGRVGTTITAIIASEQPDGRRTPPSPAPASLAAALAERTRELLGTSQYLCARAAAATAAAAEICRRRPRRRIEPRPL
ncbi:ATP-binding protein [Dactylosporangium vinaceum]|uniref:ATP-binding protein n=1 Tax=Dactylosporangium vinaceum TaxID=53362 RepID=A0ABV5MSP8_9ACTN|nr:ATP-binding protein [Dactylosporangium vinaceum]UAC00943.1 ATP-binding protein [Dactylosporangium vinaceum]